LLYDWCERAQLSIQASLAQKPFPRKEFLSMMLKIAARMQKAAAILGLCLQAERTGANANIARMKEAAQAITAISSKPAAVEGDSKSKLDLARRQQATETLSILASFHTGLQAAAPSRHEDSEIWPKAAPLARALLVHRAAMSVQLVCASVAQASR
jgi:hypothetical protein